MTREEAIKIIDCYDIGFYDLSGEKIPADKLADAFDMAIEALSVDAERGGDAKMQTIAKTPDYMQQSRHDDGRPSGEWKEMEILCNPYPPLFCVECSECGYRVGRETYLENTFNFCPNCGADMRKGEK